MRALPEGIRMIHDILLEFTPDPDAAPPPCDQCFRSMSNTRRTGRQVHGLHFSVFPTRPMSFAQFESRLLDMVCEGDCGSSDDNRQDARLAMDANKTWPPSSQAMRLVCEALWSLWQDPVTPANDAMLAFMLLHDIGARDTHLRSFLHDSTFREQTV